MADYKLVVLCNALEGRDAEFNDWYDSRHLDDVLDVPGFHRAQRLTVETVPGPPPAFGYATVYDFVSDDLDRTMGHFFSVVDTDRMPITTAMAPGAAMYVCKAAGPARERGGPTPWPARPEGGSAIAP